MEVEAHSPFRGAGCSVLPNGQWAVLYSPEPSFYEVPVAQKNATQGMCECTHVYLWYVRSVCVQRCAQCVYVWRVCGKCA